jgi:hypothetical protein
MTVLRWNFTAPSVSFFRGQGMGDGLSHDAGTKIVGVRYYTGYATIGEYVNAEREPDNQVCLKVHI